jgi:hypothetical protein
MVPLFICWLWWHMKRPRKALSASTKACIWWQAPERAEPSIPNSVQASKLTSNECRFLFTWGNFCFNWIVQEILQSLHFECTIFNLHTDAEDFVNAMNFTDSIQFQMLWPQVPWKACVFPRHHGVFLTIPDQHDVSRSEWWCVTIVMGKMSLLCYMIKARGFIIIVWQNCHTFFCFFHRNVNNVFNLIRREKDIFSNSVLCAMCPSWY